MSPVAAARIIELEGLLIEERERSSALDEEHSRQIAKITQIQGAARRWLESMCEATSFADLNIACGIMLEEIPKERQSGVLVTQLRSV